MSYIGNNPDVNTFTVSVERFSGDASCTQFQLSRTNYNDNAAIEVVISGAQQDPTANYGVQNGLITFTSAPPVGSNNIVVTYRAPIVVTFNQVTQTQISPNAVTETALSTNSVTTTKIADGSVTGNKIADTAIRANNIATGEITGNLLAQNSVSGNNLTSNAIRANNIVAGTITGNLIAEGQITGNLIAGQITGNLISSNAIRSNNIVAGQITGNLIGIGAISANNFAGGGITSNVLASNLSISTVRVAETVNVVTTAPAGNYNIHVGNTTAYYFTSNAAGSMTFNLVANDGTATGTTGTLKDLLRVGQTASIAISVKQGSTRYRANVHIDGWNPRENVFWMGSSQPAELTAQSQSVDNYSITVIKLSETGNPQTGGAEYTVFMSNTTFASANGQGMGPGGAQ